MRKSAHVVDSGCKWRALPNDFPPWRTCYGFMARWAAAESSDSSVTSSASGATRIWAAGARRGRHRHRLPVGQGSRDRSARTREAMTARKDQ
ncbi:transposase [Streptomyces sp. NPDC006475]|uniref:transposase n=1 Tax=Streptomyces sp. NPDC006475 TaxID=3155719 RepID=UPI0033B1DC81